MKDIYEEIEKISSVLINREEVTKLKNIEMKMENDLEVLNLANDFSLAQSEYNSCLNHFDRNSEEAKIVQKKLYEAKLRLDSHPLVEEYYFYLKKVNEPLRYLEFNLFDKFKNKTHKCEK